MEQSEQWAALAEWRDGAMAAIAGYEMALALAAVGLLALLIGLWIGGRGAGQARMRARLAEADADALRGERVRAAALDARLDEINRQEDAAKERHREELAEIRRQAEATRAEVDKRHDSTVARLEADIEEARGSLFGKSEENARLIRENTQMVERLEGQQQKHAALTEEIEKSRQQFVNQFRAISADLLEAQGKTTTEAQKQELEKLLSPFRIQVEGLRTGLKEMTEKADRERGELGKHIAVMQTQAAQLADEAKSLATALRGNTKKQGDWGETVLERVLEAAGLEEGTHYTRQGSVNGEDGRRLIPDVVVHLPGGRNVVIDSKVTLVAYDDYVRVEGDKVAEQAALRRHVSAVRAHVAGLSAKNYDRQGITGLDSVLMFLPIEGALNAAVAADHDLIVEAMEKRVHLMSPSSLMPVLKIVDHLWTIDRRSRNVDEIVDRAGRLHDKFVAVVEGVQAVGRALDTAKGAQETALSRMSEGRGNVVTQLDQLRRLGARAKRQLPDDLVDEFDDDMPETEDDPRVTHRAPELTGSDD